MIERIEGPPLANEVERSMDEDGFLMSACTPEVRGRLVQRRLDEPRRRRHS
jgi:hypothetical protein